MIKGLHHVAIFCSDEKKSLAFYRALGFEIVSRHDRPERNDSIINIGGNGFVLELFIQKNLPKRITNPEAYGLRHLALEVINIEELAARLSVLGYQPEAIRMDTYTNRKMTFVPDPDGLPIELHE